MSSSAHDEVVQFTSELIRFDTSNFGPGQDQPGERDVAEYVAATLDEVGIAAQLLESEPRRTTVVASWAPPGVDPSLPPLLIHGHTDVVPAQADQWSVDPFSGEIRDGCVWGRGAVDMKDFDAIVLAIVRDRVRTGRAPRRPIRLVFTADEEAGGPLGSVWLARHHPDLIADCTQAVGEVGGFSLTVAGRRMYVIQTAEKGLAWLRLIAEGTAGHGSMRDDDNAVTQLAQAVADLGAYHWPTKLHPAQRAFLDSVSEALGLPMELDDVEQTLAQLGSIARMAGATMSHTVNPTMLQAGYKANVIPGVAEATVDGRYIPGARAEFLETVRQVIGDKVRMEILHEQPGVEAPWGTPLTDAMTAAIRQYDPQATTTPFLMSAGTDAKAWCELGIQCYGFTPLQLPSDFDFVGLFHGVDERVPIESLRFAVDVFDHFLDLA
ncbi:MAG: M20/M25/M40 family metallo-hydrolase [Propionibacteriaceae bacterium]|jgi:acetylornithine deacetylase/succinyl-diaminopimelate desuccinylase-like protein|nr:M20/M25/M40 family metallo-hydrolase [Propionibacteriaceae bacterium]